MLYDDFAADLTSKVLVSRRSHTLRAQEWLQHFNYPTSRFLAPSIPYLHRLLAFRMRLTSNTRTTSETRVSIRLFF